MPFIEKSGDEVRAMSEDEFLEYLGEAAAEDTEAGGAWDQKIASAKANPPKPPAGPVKAIVSFSPTFPKGSEG